MVHYNLLYRAKEEPQQDIGEAKLVFRIKLLTCKRRSEGSNKPCAYQDPENPKRLSQTVFECLLRRYRSTGACQRIRALGAETWVWHKLPVH